MFAWMQTHAKMKLPLLFVGGMSCWLRTVVYFAHFCLIIQFKKKSPKMAKIVILDHFSAILNHFSVILNHFSAILNHFSVILDHFSVLLDLFSVILSEH